MANEDFIFRLGADISQFTKSISEVDAELKTVKSSLKNLTGQALVEANRYIQQLEQSIKNLREAGLDKLPSSATKGSAALFSLSQVARDAPFGFIAIQNNLPIVVDQFSQLAKTSGGLKGALKDIGSALIGPAGISFAFGAVIAGVTALIQKYGSLGNAFEALIGGQKQLTKEQKEFAKNLASESSEILTLATLYPKFNNNKDEQAKIIKKLNQLSPEYFGNLKTEKTSIDDITASLDKYINSFIGKIYIESQQKRINELFTKYAEQITRVVDKENERVNSIKNTRSNIQGLEKDNDKYFKSVIENAKKIPTGDIAVGVKIVPTKTTIQDAIDTLKTDLKTQLSGVFEEIDLFKQFINIDDFTKTKKEVVKSIKEIEGAWLGFAPQAVIAGDNFNKVLQKNAKEAKNLEGWRNIILQIRQAYDATSNSIGNTQIYLKSLSKIVDQTNSTFESMFQNMQNADMLFNIEGVQRNINNVFKNISENTKTTTKDLQKSYNNIAHIIESSLVDPLTYLFETVLEGGKISWKEFGNIVIEQLKRILVQIIATTAAVAIADAITGGGYSATARLADKATGGGGFGRSTPGAVNMGGITQGGLAMSGSVALSLRGSDLIGAINRTNTNINRIG